MNDTAILVTTYTGGNEPEKKKQMTKNICEALSKTGHFVLLASHSPISEETQQFCNYFIYDADNTFQINGMPYRNDHHPVAEFKSMHDAIRIFKRLGFKNFLKVTYDNDPVVDYADIIQQCKNTGKRAVTARWHGVPTTMGTMVFFTEIDFFELTFGLHEVRRFDTNIEDCWYSCVAEKGGLGETLILDSYDDFFGHKILSYADCGGTQFKDYPY
jgi:hypothetical protein